VLAWARTAGAQNLRVDVISVTVVEEVQFFVPPRNLVSAPERPLFPPERAITLLTQQLRELEHLKGRQYSEAIEEENQWQHLTAEIIWKAFDHNSANHLRFQNAKNAGDHTLQSDFPGVRRGPSRDQPNFEARIKAFESLLKAIIKELEMSLPDKEIKGAYGPGDDYEFYKDLKTIIETAKSSLFIIDNYLDVQLFDLYMERAAPSVDIRILTDQLRGAVQTVAGKFSKRGHFELRTSGGTHDRHLFLDNRGWVIGQSIKDAAQRKPTYIVELNDAAPLLGIYDHIWSTATLVVKG